MLYIVRLVPRRSPAPSHLSGQLFSAKKSVDNWTATGTLISRLVVITIGTGAAIAICGALTLALFVTTVGASFQYLPACVPVAFRHRVISLIVRHVQCIHLGKAVRPILPTSSEIVLTSVQVL